MTDSDTRVRYIQSMLERNGGEVTKDKWIQQAKALLAESLKSLDSPSLKQEVRELIALGGGYDEQTEVPGGPLKWPGRAVDVSFRDAHKGQSDMTLDEVITAIQEIRRRYGNGSVPCRILMEPAVSGETVQLDDGLSEVSASVGGRAGESDTLHSVVFLGRSFD